MATGIVVRELAPLLRSKHNDPAVGSFSTSEAGTRSVCWEGTGAARINWLAVLPRCWGGPPYSPHRAMCRHCLRSICLALTEAGDPAGTNTRPQSSRALVNGEPVALYPGRWRGRLAAVAFRRRT